MDIKKLTKTNGGGVLMYQPTRTNTRKEDAAK